MSKANPLLATCGSLFVLLSLVWLLRVRDNADMHVALWLLAGFILILVPLFMLRGASLSRGSTMILVSCAVVARLLVLGSIPILSDDVYRYLWDGQVQSAGINPYRYAPADSRLDVPRDSDYEQINHKEIPTIYPPLAQFAFFLCAWIFPSVWSFKIAFVFLDLTLAWLLWRRGQSDCAHRPPPTGALALYLFHPLVLLEFAGSGHVDLLWTLPFIACLWALERKRPHWALVLFALAISGKLIALAYLPLFWQRAGGRRTLAAGLLALAFYLPYISAGFGLLGGLTAYGLFWNFNGFLFPVLGLLPGGAVTARLAAPLFGALAAWRIARKSPDLWTAALATTAVMIVLLPVNYPWYWAVLVALLVIRPYWSLFGFSLALMLTYEILPRYYATGVWHQAVWVRLLQAALLAVGLWEVLAPTFWRSKGRAPKSQGGSP